MQSEQVFIGVATAALCLVGLWKSAWFLEHSRKGRSLADWCGARKAVWIIRGLFITGAAFGILLATGVVNPVRW